MTSKHRIIEHFGETLALIQHLLSHRKIREIEAQLQTDTGFWTLLPEMEWAALLVRAKAREIKLEPNHPAAGPDIEAVLVSRPIQFEIKAPWGKESDYKLLSSFDTIIDAAHECSRHTANVHVHFTSMFSAGDSQFFVKQMHHAAKFAKNVPVTVVYFERKRSTYINAWAPMMLVDPSEFNEGSWIRRNYHTLMPVATWPTWRHALRSYTDLPRASDAGDAKALFSFESLDMHSPRLANISFGVTTTQRQERWSFITGKLKKTRRQSTACPFVFVFETTHLPNITEFDILIGAFGKEYCRSLLKYALGLQQELSASIKVGCPSYISAIVTYNKWLNDARVRLYRNPRAAVPLSDAEVGWLMKEFPYRIQTEEDRYASYKDMLLLRDPTIAPVRGSKERSIDSLLDQSLLHFIDMETYYGQATNPSR